MAICIVSLISLYLSAAEPDIKFIHPGCLSTAADLKRMADKVAKNEQPWKGSWDILVRNTDNFMDDKPRAEETIFVDSKEGSSNYIRLAGDTAKAYQLALRYHGSGDSRFADKAVEIFNKWAAVHRNWNGNSNICLRSGLYGMQFACAAELLRGYKGWDAGDFKLFQKYMLERFYSVNDAFLNRRNGTVADHYWANWVQSSQASMMAIGILCDDRKIFNKAVDYFYNGPGNENIKKAVNFIHPNGLGQWQESGRDQGHTLMGPQLLGSLCEMAWNQGVDLYGYDDNRFLKSVEYISKYNLGLEVPFVVYPREFKHPGRSGIDLNEKISSHGRGLKRPGWDLVVNHYVNRLGMAAPYTDMYAEKCRPEGGGYNYGGNSGGFDGLGFTTLTHSLEPVGKVIPPSHLNAHIEGTKITLSWMGTARALKYKIKRSTKESGPFIQIAESAPEDLFYVDSTAEPGKTYYYGVSAGLFEGETSLSKIKKVTATYQITGKIIGTAGSFNNDGAAGKTVFDGSLENYFDPPVSNAWVGMDLGQRTKIIMIRYCPRKGFEDRMTGGKFQGSNSADFSRDVVDLFTIPSRPPHGQFSEAAVKNTDSFQYIRYIPPEGSWCNVAELQFFGRQ